MFNDAPIDHSDCTTEVFHLQIFRKSSTLGVARQIGHSFLHLSDFTNLNNETIGDDKANLGPALNLPVYAPTDNKMLSQLGVVDLALYFVKNE